MCHCFAEAVPAATRHPSRDCAGFCGTGFQPVKNHGQDGRATSFDTIFRTVPPGTACSKQWHTALKYVDQFPQHGAVPPQHEGIGQHTRTGTCTVITRGSQRVIVYGTCLAT